SALGTPGTSSPNATLSTTRRWASRPKCWKTIEDVWRRSSRRSDWEAAQTSRPSISISPAVGSISRMSVRTSVDFPEPERPITTKTSCGQTSKETLRTAATQPVFSRSSRRGSSASGVPMTFPALAPKIFQTPSARISGGPLRSTWCAVGAGTTVAAAVSAVMSFTLHLGSGGEVDLGKPGCGLSRCGREPGRHERVAEQVAVPTRGDEIRKVDDLRGSLADRQRHLGRLFERSGLLARLGLQERLIGLAVCGRQRCKLLAKRPCLLGSGGGPVPIVCVPSRHLDQGCGHRPRDGRDRAAARGRLLARDRLEEVGQRQVEIRRAQPSALG